MKGLLFTLEICRKSCQQDPNTVTETLNSEKQELSNCNNNRNTAHTQHHETKANTRRKFGWRGYKETYVWKEDHITISQKLRLKIVKTETDKINAYFSGQYYKVKQTNAGVKCILDEIGVPLKKTNRNLEP